MSRIHPLDAARLEVLRYADLVASWKPDAITSPHNLAMDELDGLRKSVDRLKNIHPHACDGAEPIFSVNDLSNRDSEDPRDTDHWDFGTKEKRMLLRTAVANLKNVANLGFGGGHEIHAAAETCWDLALIVNGIDSRDVLRESGPTYPLYLAIIHGND